ncbi:MAG: S26 family signal peptidase [Hyphomonadaceae bacterium]|nr:S26 family signal peptidase [Hyphomonadaceae bacterium]
MDRQSKSPWLTLAEAAAILNLKQRTLEGMRWHGVGPSFRKHGGRTFYHHDDLKEWFDNGPRGPTAGRPKRSLRPLLFMLAGIALVTAACLPKHPLLIWNASPSVPIGLYLSAPGFPRLGELALVQLTGPMAMSAHRRGYLRRGAYLLKPVAAVTGDRVCRFGTHVFVRGRRAALALAKDSIGRYMPAWHGCRTLGPGEVFVLAENPASFDSRYFGIVRTEHLAGYAMRLWSRGQSN